MLQGFFCQRCHASNADCTFSIVWFDVPQSDTSGCMVDKGYMESKISLQEERFKMLYLQQCSSQFSRILLKKIVTYSFHFCILIKVS